MVAVEDGEEEMAKPKPRVGVSPKPALKGEMVTIKTPRSRSRAGEPVIGRDSVHIQTRWGALFAAAIAVAGLATTASVTDKEHWPVPGDKSVKPQLGSRLPEVIAGYWFRTEEVRAAG